MKSHNVGKVLTGALEKSMCAHTHGHLAQIKQRRSTETAGGVGEQAPCTPQLLCREEVSPVQEAGWRLQSPPQEAGKQGGSWGTAGSPWAMVQPFYAIGSLNQVNALCILTTNTMYI